MAKTSLLENRFLKRNGKIWGLLLRQLLYVLMGAMLYFVFAWLGGATFEPAIGKVTFRPATVILTLFGLLFGPWVGLFTGLIGKTLTDYISGWGFYWNGSIAYGLIGFLPGFMKASLQELRSGRSILKAIIWGGLGVLAAALFLAVTELFMGDISLDVALRHDFWPEFAGNLGVVIVFLPLVILALLALERRRKK